MRRRCIPEFLHWLDQFRGEILGPVAVEPAETLAKGAARKRGFAQQLREDAALMPPDVGADFLAWAAQADDEADALEAAAASAVAAGA